MDFVSDALSSGRCVRTLIIMDDASREALADKWLDNYNSQHPHRSMKGLTPNQKRILLKKSAMKKEDLIIEINNQV
ncbi:integrase core domain-containing protein [Dyadobacter sp. CY347]|uniref:integrase core domain-containing protein n=1 Tax=Dyadobacter sp. CY347 TaxID=2909336 RepID=UPI0038D42659